MAFTENQIEMLTACRDKIDENVDMSFKSNTDGVQTWDEPSEEWLEVVILADDEAYELTDCKFRCSPKLPGEVENFQMMAEVYKVTNEEFGGKRIHVIVGPSDGSEIDVEDC